MKTYDIGDRVRLIASFTSPDDSSPVDPDQVTVKYSSPAGATVELTYGNDPQVVRDEPGRYHVDIDVNVAGRWRFRWGGTGNNAAAAEGIFNVRESYF